MLNAFFTWWLQRLAELMPGRLARRDSRGGNALVIDAEPGEGGTPSGVVLALRRDRQEGALGRFVLDYEGIQAMKAALAARPRPPTTLLRLPHTALLDRQVALPLAAERDPGRALHYEMDRLTPFASEEVYWSWTIESRDRVRGKLLLRLTLVPKAGLVPLMASLDAAGAAPSAIEGPSLAGGVRRIELGQPDGQTLRWRGRVVAAAAGACAVLAVVAIVLPFVLQSLALTEIEAEIDGLRPRVAQADALRRRIASNAASTDVISAERARDGDALQILSGITDLLPDDTFLTDFVLRQRKITLSGQSAAAARLIGALSADPSVRNASFTAPVTRIEGGRGDLFALRADIGP